MDGPEQVRWFGRCSAEYGRLPASRCGGDRRVHARSHPRAQRDAAEWTRRRL